MAVQTLITSRKHYNQYANAGALGSNLTEFFTYLRGGVMNVQKIVYEVEIQWSDLANYNSNGVRFSLNGNQLIRNDGSGSWIDEGFAVDDVIDFEDIGIGFVFTDRNITNITDKIIIFDGAAIPQATYDNAIVYGGKTDLFGLEYSFGIIENNDPESFKSLLDGSDQTYYADNIGLDTGGGRSTSFVAMQPKTNTILGWDSSRTGNTKVRYMSRPSTYVQKFEIEHEYIINPYNDQTLLDQNKSYRYLSKIDFRHNVANINTAKVTIDDLQKGSVGWFGENYDGYNNDFTITDLVYTDVATASTVTELNISSKTRVNFSVQSASGYFSTNDPYVVFHSFIPEFDQYDRSPDTFRDTWVFETNRSNIDAGALSNGIIKDLTASLVNANEIDVQFDIEFTNDQQQKLEEGDEYVIAIEVGDGDLTNQAVNVTLRIDQDNYSKDNNIPDLMISDEFGFNPYYKFIAPTNDLFSTYFGWIEDEIVSFHRFGVNRTPAKDAEILGGRFKLVAYKDSTGDTFDLQEEELDLSSQLNAPAGTVNANPWPIQLIVDSRTRGYRLRAGDEFNLLLFETDDNDGTYQYYEWRIGFKMNWQSWIALPSADNIFIDTSDTFDGKNNRASNYSLKEGYSIRVLWEFDMQGLDDDGNQGETDYKFYTQAFSIFDFDEQDDDPVTWDCDIYTYDQDDNNLGGAILEDEYTKVKAVFTPQAPFVITDITPYWGEIRIAEQNQPGFVNDIISTTKPFLDNNILIPLDGDTYASITLVSNTIEVECRVDYTKLKKNVGYKLSGRLANQDEPIAPIVWTFTTESDIPTDAPFNPSVVTIGGEVPTWTLQEGYNQTTINFSKSDRTGLGTTELDGTCQDVDVTFSTNNPGTITEMDFGTDQICQSLDLTLFTSCMMFDFRSNNIDSVTFPTSSASITDVRFENNNITGALDLSGLSDLKGDIRFQNNSITSVSFTSNPGLISVMYFQNNNLSTVDLSGFTRLAGDVDFNGNSNLTSATFPTSSDVFSDLLFFGCDLGSADLSGLTGLRGNVRFQNNTNLSSVTFPTLTTGAFTFIRFDNCNLSTVDLSPMGNIGGYIDFSANSITSFTMPGSSIGTLSKWLSQNNSHGYIDLTIFAGYSAALDVNMSGNVLTTANVNQILIDLDGVLGAGSGTINLSGQTPSAPPSGAGITAKNNLIGKGWTVATD